MDESQFLMEEYKTLREEIRETKARIFKLLGFGIFAVPVAHFVAQTYSLDIIIISLPLLVIVVALLYLSENHALMRCGCYIREHIEPKVDTIREVWLEKESDRSIKHKVEDTIGWEIWLERESDRRTVDKYVGYCFNLLVFIYYGGSVFMAAHFAFENYGIVPLSIIIGFYIAIGIWFLIFFIKTIKYGTRNPENH